MRTWSTPALLFYMNQQQCDSMLISACFYLWCQTESGTAFLFPVSYTVCVHCQISVSAPRSSERRVKKEKLLEHICVQRNKGSLVFRALREGMPSYCPCEIHRPFLLVSPSTVGDFPNCKSSPFIVPTNSGWQHSLHCHTPHYNQPKLLQLLSVRVYVSSKCFRCP